MNKKGNRRSTLAFLLAGTLVVSVAMPRLASAGNSAPADRDLLEKSSHATGTDYYFPGVDIEALEQSDIPQNCFWKAWYSGNYFAYSKTVPIGSGNNPETWVTYSPAKFKLPAGAILTLKGEYPHARYFGIDTYSGPFPVDAISGFQIEPDSGATNPFRTGADRSAQSRGYTLTLVEQVKPERPAPNTLYLRPAQAGSIAGYSPELRLRTYFPDRGQDVLGGVAYPRLDSLELADGRVISGEDNICRSINLNTTLGDLSETALPLSILNTLVSIAPDPARAPAQETPLWERFFNISYSLFGLFLLPGGEEMRAQIPVPKPDGGGGGSLAGTVANAYVATYLSHETPEREIAVTRVKVANTPRTFDNPQVLESPEPLQAQYWSICTNVDVAGNGLTAEGFPTGVRQGMCHNDETVVLNEDRYTRIVHSQPRNRPKHATNECGWSWLNSGPGDALGRPVVQVIVRPGLAGEESFVHNSTNVKHPGTEAKIMGDYLPVTEYMSRAEFDAMGCNRQGFAQPAGRPDLPAPVWGTQQTIKPAYPVIQLPENVEMPRSVFGMLKLLKDLSSGS